MFGDENDVILWISTKGYACVSLQAKTFINQLCADPGSRQEDLPRAIADKDGWMEK